MSEERKPRRRRKVRKLNLIRLLFVSGLLIFLIGVGSVLGFVLYSAKDMPAWNPAALQPNLPSFIYDKDGNEVTKIYVENRVPIEFEKVPDTVKSAFLAIEDVRFYEHNGLDVKRILGAFVADIKAGYKAQGASTITQQLVKRAFLNPDKTFKRKIQEAILSIQIERKFTKNEIFEMYLNQIYFGEGAYGLQSAANVYFGIKAEELNLQEAALLASLPKAPNSYDPYKDIAAATRRRNIVLDSMAKYGFITGAQADTAKAQDIILTGTRANELGTYKFPYFVDYITELLIAKYGEDKVYKGGLKVYTTLDPKIQTAAEEVLASSKYFPKAKRDSKGLVQPQAAVVVIDQHTGFIKSIVGGRDHTQRRQFNRATDAVRQPGSAFKPVIDYGPAIEKGKSPADVVDDAPTKFGSKEFKNYDGQFHGIVTYRKAIINSYNIPAVKILKETGISKAIAFARKLGIKTLVNEQDENLSVGLGGLTKGVKPLELAGAYGAFANNGVWVEPTAITRIEDRDGNIIDDFKPKKTIAMKQTTAYIMTDMMESAVKYGTGNAASLGGRPVAGKTGTTSDYKDAWFAGYTPELTAVVWMGHDEPTPMRGVTGGTYPARIWKAIMSKALKDKPVKDFDKPDGIVSATVCSASGDKPSDICPEDALVTDIFAKGTVPSKICDVHVLIKVCAESDQLPTDKCPTVITKAFVKGKEPTQTCTLHGGNAVKQDGTPVCTDPQHGGIFYKALVPGPDQEGGCPPDMVKYEQFSPEQEPTAYCTIPEHQIRPKNPQASEPSVPDGVQNTSNPNSPQSPEPPLINKLNDVLSPDKPKKDKP
jgi:penicillin-binding protein 1A